MKSRQGGTSRGGRTWAEEQQRKNPRRPASIRRRLVGQSLNESTEWWRGKKHSSKKRGISLTRPSGRLTALVKQLVATVHSRHVVHHVDSLGRGRRHHRAPCCGHPPTIRVGINRFPPRLGRHRRLPRRSRRCGCRSRLLSSDERRQSEAVGPSAVDVAEHFSAVGYRAERRDVGTAAVGALKSHSVNTGKTVGKWRSGGEGRELNKGRRGWSKGKERRRGDVPCSREEGEVRGLHNGHDRRGRKSHEEGGG